MRLRTFLALPFWLAACGAGDGPRPMPPAALVAEAPNPITAFAVDEAFLYWGDTAGGETTVAARVVRVPRAGGTPEVLSTGGNVVAALLAGADRLTWAEGDGSVQCMRLRTMDKATGAIVTLDPGPVPSCSFLPVGEYDGRLLVLADDATDGTRLGQLYRFDPTGATPPEPSVRFGASIDPLVGTSRTGPSLYVGHRDDCGLRVFRADLHSSSQAPAFTWALPQTSGFVVLPAEGAYWVNQRYVDRSDLHVGWDSGLTEGVLASFEGGVSSGPPLVDGDDLWLGGPAGPLRVHRATGAVERYTWSLLPTIFRAARPEGLYVAEETRIFLQPRP